MKSAMENKGEIILFQTLEGKTELEVKLERETLWLSQYQLANLFETDRTSILKHIKNIYETSELPGSSTCAKFAHVRKEGKRPVTRQILHYNLNNRGVLGSWCRLQFAHVRHQTDSSGDSFFIF